MEPDEIVFVIGHLGRGGTEHHLMQVLPLLRRRGFHPLLFTLTHAGPLAPALREDGVDVLAPPFSAALRRLPRFLRAPLTMSFATLRLALLLRRRQTRIVHFFLPAAYIIGGIVSLLVGPSLRVMSRRSLNNYQSKRAWSAPIERQLHRRMSAVLGNSRAVVDQLLEEGVPSSRLGLIYNGIGQVTPDIIPSRLAAREGLGIATDVLVLVMVANLIPYKGHADALEALGSIRHKLPEGWLLLCVGRDDGIGTELATRAERLKIAGNLRWLGERSDVPALLAACDIGLLCSHEEGFSNALLEYMAAGLPTVATDVGGNAEAVVHGETGYIVPAERPGLLAQAISELAASTELRRHFGAAGRTRVERRFSLQSAVNAYAALYEALLDGQPLPIDPGCRTVTTSPLQQMEKRP